MQIVEYVGDRRQRVVKYIGSAHTPAELGVVMARPGPGRSWSHGPARRPCAPGTRRVASQAPRTPSRTSGSTPARVRANVERRGGRRRTPTRWPSQDGRSAAQAAIAATERDPASTAAVANVKTVANECRTPRRSRGPGTVDSTCHSSTTSSSPSGVWSSTADMNEDVQAGMTTSRTRERTQHPSRSARPPHHPLRVTPHDTHPLDFEQALGRSPRRWAATDRRYLSENSMAQLATMTTVTTREVDAPELLTHGMIAPPAGIRFE